MKKNKIIIALIIITVIIALITLLHTTLAVSSTITNDNDVYTINLTENNNTVITVPGNSTKTVIYHIKNTSKGNVKYGIGYTGSDISIKTYDDTIDKAEDTIAYGESKFVKLYISNKSATSSTTTIKTVLGYEHGGDLIVPSGYTLVNSSVTNAQELIKKLYKDSTKTQVINNNITYNYASSVNLMNDRLGGTTTSLDGGNIRYYGASPNNYIYFNCETYPNTNCEIWRIIGIFDGKLKITNPTKNDFYFPFDYDKNDDGTSTTYDSNWSTSTLQKLLNNGYYNNTIGEITYYFTDSSLRERNNTKNMSNIGLKNVDTRKLISSEKWYLGSNYGLQFANEVYVAERSNISCEDCNYDVIWNGNIALPYLSDFGYAGDFNACNVSTISSNCKGWMLFSSMNYWLLSIDTATTIMSVFWPTVTCIYLSVSFITFAWALTWVIWPIAAVIHAIFKSILKDDSMEV